MTRIRSICISCVLFIMTFAVIPAAQAGGCGLDPVCAVSESVGRGAGGALADQLKPLITDVMEREAPALISQLQGSVDHNIMTAQEAGEHLITLATDLLDKTAADIQLRGQKLIDYANGAVLAAEKQLFVDLNATLDRLHCEILGTNILISNQADDFISRIKGMLPWWTRFTRSKTETSCRKKWGIDQSLPVENLGVTSLYLLWRCIRLESIDVTNSLSIMVAYADAGERGKGAICALHNASETGFETVTELWIDDELSAKAWKRARESHEQQSN